MKQVFWIFCLLIASPAAQAQTPLLATTIPQPGHVTTTTKTAPVAAAPTVAPTMPVAPGPLIATPVTPTIAPVTNAQETKPAVTTAPLTTVPLNEQFKGQLPFMLDETKMVAFTEASRRVKKINEKWDVQIAAADTDLRAKEYNTFAVEEITKALENIPGLTLDQYTAMTKLTATNPDFNQVYMAYKELLDNGKIKAPAAKKVTIATPTKPVVTPVTPANSGTVPAPQDLPKTPYSPPSSRQ